MAMWPWITRCFAPLCCYCWLTLTGVLMAHFLSRLSFCHRLHLLFTSGFFGWFKSFPKTPFNSSQSVVATPVKWNVFILKVSRDPKHTHPFICCRFWRDDVLHSLTIIIFCVLYNTCQRSLLLDLACMTQIPFIESTFWWTMSLSLNWIWFFLLLTIFSCSILYLLLNPFACWQRNTFSISLSILKAKPAYFTWNNDPDWLCFA